MTVLLTGATGFVGGPLLQRLLAEGRRVRVLVRDRGRLADPQGAGERLEVHQGTLSDPASLAGAAAGITAVVHLAGLVAARRSAAFYAVNRRGTALLAAEVRRHAPEARWVQVSSLAAGGPAPGAQDPDRNRPVSHYGRSKLEGEEAVRAAGLKDWLILRPPAVYGPGDRAFLPFFQRVARGQRVPVPSVAGQRFSFVHVDDLCSALSASLAAPAQEPGAVLYPAHPGHHSLLEFLAFLGAAVGRPPRRLPLRPALAWTLAGLVAPFRALTGRPRFFSLDKMHEVTASSWCCSPALAEERLGWSAKYDLRAGTAHTVEAYRRAGWLPPGPEAAPARPEGPATERLEGPA